MIHVHVWCQQMQPCTNITVLYYIKSVLLLVPALEFSLTFVPLCHDDSPFRIWRSSNISVPCYSQRHQSLQSSPEPIFTIHIVLDILRVVLREFFMDV
jgi:hypothetical protein